MKKIRTNLSGNFFIPGRKYLRIMKLTFILMLWGLMTFASATYSQNTRLTFESKDASIESIFKQIESLSEFKFAYNSSKLDVEKKISVKADNESIGVVLDKILESTSFKYKIVDRYIIITDENGANPIIIGSEQAKKTVTGKVTDASGATLPGVSVIVKGTTLGVITDNNGTYTLSNVPENAVLQFSFVGMTRQELPVEGKTTMNVLLTYETIGVEEVVVVGYGTQKQARVTGAVSSVKMAEVMGSRPVSNVGQLLQGNVPGLQVTYSSGEPDAKINLNIRGTTSIGQGSSGSPLILLDNVPISSLDLINPNDIESVNILKDAGSAAVYGARSAWGVILLTSKNNTKIKKVSFEYSNVIAFSQPLEMPQKASPTQDVQSFKDMNLTPGGGQQIDTWLNLLSNYAKNPSAYPLGYTFQNGIIYPLKETDVWKEMMSANAFQMTHNLTMGGGSEKITYRIAAGSTNEDGILISDKDNYKKFNITSYVSSEITSWASAQLISSYSKSNKRFPYTGYAFGIFGSASVMPSYTILGDSLINGVNVPYATPKNLIDGSIPNSNILENTRLSGKVTLKPAKGFTIIGEYTYDKINTTFTQYDKPFNVITIANFVPVPTVTDAQSKYYKYNDFTDYQALNIYGTYEKKWTDHSVSIMAGFNQEDSYRELLDAQMSNMINPELPYLDGGTGVIQADANGFDGFSENSVRGYFYRLNYAFKGKYLFETTGRFDGSSRFPENSRWGFFPSFSLGWRLSDEAFMVKLKPVISDLKIRASYGNVGNQSIGNYLYFAGMTARPTSNWANTAGIRYLSLNPPGLISADFTWEKVTTKNLGIDLRILDNKLINTFDLYTRETKGMLIPGAQLPAVLGASSPLQNTADLKSDGWEFQTIWKDKIGKVGYHIGFNISDNNGTITKYDINATGLLTQYYVGQKIGEIWGYVTDGLYSIDDFVPGSLNSNFMGGKLNPGVIKYQGQNPNPGDIKFKDLNNDGIIYTGDNTLSNPGDRKIIGNNGRHYQYGITGGVNLRDFDFSFFIQGVGKRDVFLVSDLTFPYSSNYGTLYSNVLDYWTPSNTNAHYGRIYNLGGGNSSYNKLPQTRFIQNGAYLRLKNVTIGYNIPSSVCKKMHLQFLRLFVGGEDLLTIKHLPAGVDPEFSDMGYGAQYPIMKKMTLGLTLNF